MKLSIGLKLIGIQFLLTLAALLLVSAAATSGLLRWLPGYVAAERLWICGLSAVFASLLGWAVARATLLRLIAQGLSNAEIAEKLVVTERTVKAHVSNVLSKLQLNDRTQAAIYAWREGIVENRE